MDFGSVNFYNQNKELLNNISRIVNVKKIRHDDIDLSTPADLDKVISATETYENRILISIYFELFSQDPRANYLISEEAFTNFMVINKKYLDFCLRGNDWANAIR